MLHVRHGSITKNGGRRNSEPGEPLLVMAFNCAALKGHVPHLQVLGYANKQADLRDGAISVPHHPHTVGLTLQQAAIFSLLEGLAFNL